MILVAVLWACGGSSAPPLVMPELDAVVIYSGRPAELVTPWWDRLREQRGITVQVEYGESGPLAGRVLQEGAWGLADLVFVQESVHLDALGEALEPLPADVLDAVAPAFRDPEGRWVGTSGRLRVMVYDPARVPELPRTMAELSSERWAPRVGWVPSNSSLHAHLGLLRAVWGLSDTHRWVGELVQRGAKALPKNAAVVDAVASGAVDIGLTHHNYLPAMRRPGLAQAMFPTPHDPGNVLMLAAIGLRKDAARRERALEIVRWLVSADMQQQVVSTTFEYPTRPDIAPPPGSPALASDLLYAGDMSGLTDGESFRQLLEHLGQR